MMNRPKAFERYRHFKGREYQVLCIAKNESDMKEMVVYQALYEPYEIYVRELESFCGRVDKERYPHASQTYRFEAIGAEDGSLRAETAHTEGAGAVDPVLMQFLDAEDGQDKLNVLNENAGRITVGILTPMELSLGMEPSEADIDERIRNIRNNIQTRMKYEKRR